MKRSGRSVAEARRVIEIDEVPRTATGKVQRYRLREAEEVQATLAGA